MWRPVIYICPPYSSASLQGIQESWLRASCNTTQGVVSRAQWHDEGSFLGAELSKALLQNRLVSKISNMRFKPECKTTMQQRFRKRKARGAKCSRMSFKQTNKAENRKALMQQRFGTGTASNARTPPTPYCSIVSSAMQQRRFLETQSQRPPTSCSSEPP
jgi:hypothetical protein